MENMLPFTLDDSYVCVTNGADNEPCALKVRGVAGKKMVKVEKNCHEWCRLLTSKPRSTHPLASSKLQIWNKWEKAIDEAFARLQTKKRQSESLEEDQDHHVTTVPSRTTAWRQKRKRWKTNPVLEIIMPTKPHSEETFALTVETTHKTFAFEYKAQNVQWLRDYVLKELEEC